MEEEDIWQNDIYDIELVSNEWFNPSCDTNNIEINQRFDADWPYYICG